MENTKRLVHPKEDFYFIFCILISVGVYLAFLFSIIGIFFIVFLILFSLTLHFLMIGSIRRNAVKIGENQFPLVYERAVQICLEMKLEKVPDIYIMESGGLLNAFATKFFRRNMVVLYSDIFELIEMDAEDEVYFILAHELAHIKRRHITIQMVILPAMWVPFIGEAYSRACEYTCDRYAAYYTNNFEAAKNGLTILAIGRTLYKSVNHDDYLKQVRDESGFFVWLSEKISTHPHLPKRIQEVAQFMDIDFPYYKESKRGVVIGIVGLTLAVTIFVVGSYMTIDRIMNSSLWSDFFLGVEGTTPLMDAAFEANIEEVQKLIDEGAEVNVSDSEGSTPLHWTIYGIDFTYEEGIEVDNIPSIETARLLLDAGANVNAVDIYGTTPLIDAVSYDSPEMVELLLEYGADPLITDANGMTALDLAKDYQNQEILTLLNTATQN
ncbi:ankyrin repeat domain-containing protein [Bacillus luteolus]|uniref:Ankyrin repeat domain-containing protein n=1 Tax=Litchfieldia luteola TaxID=682179 RepID=A0ABR9QIJ8_9BACI|nr:M48 family metallopeptidase [Cytobacillus luteolus]MBE4908329.1 ankyrin repeat domain-containing protein [Cytobacillus luteolus]MBP1943117.1 Zn-dependent protease with chaperone function [Cytobacillus luteolus]